MIAASPAAHHPQFHPCAQDRHRPRPVGDVDGHRGAAARCGGRQRPARQQWQQRPGGRGRRWRRCCGRRHPPSCSYGLGRPQKRPRLVLHAGAADPRFCAVQPGAAPGARAAACLPASAAPPARQRRAAGPSRAVSDSPIDGMSCRPSPPLVCSAGRPGVGCGVSHPDPARPRPHHCGGRRDGRGHCAAHENCRRAAALAAARGDHEPDHW